MTGTVNPPDDPAMPARQPAAENRGDLRSMLWWTWRLLVASAGIGLGLVLGLILAVLLGILPFGC